MYYVLSPLGKGTCRVNASKRIKHGEKHPPSIIFSLGGVQCSAGTMSESTIITLKKYLLNIFLYIIRLIAATPPRDL